MGSAWFRRLRQRMVVLVVVCSRVRHDETDGDLWLAALWRRAVAWSIDVLLFAGATFAIVAAIGIQRPLALVWHLLRSGPGSFTPSVLHQLVGAKVVLSLAVLVGGFAVWVVYRVVCTGRWGRTLGKVLLGIRVVRAEDPSAPPGLRRAALRWVLLPLAGSIPLPGTGLLVYLMAVRNQRRQGGHDRAARTVVIRQMALVDVGREASTPRAASLASTG